MRVGYGPLIAIILALGIVLGAVFGTGVIYGRGTAKPATPVAAAGAPPGGPAAPAGGTPAGGASPAGASPFAGQVVGTVASVQNGTITVRGLNGQTSTFSTADSTQVTNSVPASVNSLQSGELVSVTPGPPDAEGRTRASAVAVLPLSLANAITGGAGGAPPARTPGP